MELVAEKNEVRAALYAGRQCKLLTGVERDADGTVILTVFNDDGTSACVQLYADMAKRLAASLVGADEGDVGEIMVMSEEDPLRLVPDDYWS